MTEIEELRAVVLAQSKILGQLLAGFHPDELPFELTGDEGFELLDLALGDLPPDVRQRYFAEVDRFFPTHSSER